VIDQAMVRCICEIANGTGLRTIAEYVETVEVENLLRSMGFITRKGICVTNRPRWMRC